LKKKLKQLLWWPNLIKQVQKKEISQMLELSASDYMLDVGCGRGEFDTYLKGKRPTLQIMAGDIVERRAWQDYKHRLPFLVFDGKYLPFKSDVFDRFLFSEILFAVDEPGEMIREASRVLKDGGLLVTVNGTGYKRIASFYASHLLRPLRQILVRYTQLPPTYYAFYREYIARNISADEQEFSERLKNLESSLERQLESHSPFTILKKGYSFNTLNEILLSVLWIGRAAFGLGRPRFNFFTLYPIARLIEVLIPQKKDGLCVIFVVRNNKNRSPRKLEP
jgi:ubiquinone/menaquinone biosynthesis C-methylase UbiE